MVFFAPPGPSADGFVFSGDVFTDRSRMGARDVTAGIGCAAVSYNLHTNQTAVAIYRPMPAAYQVQVRILRAELWAFYQVLVSAMFPMTIYIDNATVVNGFHRGPAWCCSSNRPHADVWRLIWTCVSDLGPDTGQLTVVK